MSVIDMIPHWQMHLGGPGMADLWGSYSYVRGRSASPIPAHQLGSDQCRPAQAQTGHHLPLSGLADPTPRLQWIGDTIHRPQEQPGPGGA